MARSTPLHGQGRKLQQEFTNAMIHGRLELFLVPGAAPLRALFLHLCVEVSSKCNCPVVGSMDIALPRQLLGHRATSRTRWPVTRGQPAGSQGCAGSEGYSFAPVQSGTI